MPNRTRVTRRRPPSAAADLLEPRRLLSTGPATVTFAAPATYGSGSSLGPVLADLTGGGLPDVVSPNSAGGAQGVTVFPNADGVLGTGVSYDTGSDGEQPFQAATADFDGDGHADVATANYGTGLSVLFGTGTGTLGRLATYAAGSTPDGIVVGDFNGDGHPDIAVSNRGSGNVSVFLNNGDGTFAPAVDYAVGTAPQDIAVADLNGDGHLDLVTADGNGVSVLLGTGTGTFAAAVPVATASPSTFVAVADLNGDGHPDLVVADSSPAVEVLLGTGTGTTFGAPAVQPVASAFATIAIADFNADGHPDVAGAANATGTASILLGNGDGTLGAEQVFQAGLDAYSIAAGDLNGDGRPDLVVGAYAGSTPAIAVLLNTTGTPTPTPTPTVTKAIGGLDPTFGTGGLASHDVGFTATTGVADDASAGSILIGPVGAVPNEAFGVTRYTTNGALDTGFGTGGVTTTAFAGTDAAPAAVAVLADGEILVAGTATTYAADGATVDGSRFAVAEYTAAGALDPAFGTGGVVTFGFGAALTHDVLTSLALGTGGAIYLGGSTDVAGTPDFAIARLTATGAPDATFATGGLFHVDFAGGADAANALAVQPNGAVVAAGSAVVGGVTEVALARVLATGALDRRFGAKGLVTDKVGGVYDAARSVVVQPKGQIVIGGLTATGSGASLGSDFLVQRYTAAGRPDGSFGRRGTVTTSFGQPSAVTQVQLQADGTIVASGRTAATLGAATYAVALARYTTRGTADASFAGTGKTTVDLSAAVTATPAVLSADLGAAFDAFTSSSQGVVTTTPGGEILAAGNSGANTVEAELIADAVDLVAKLLGKLPASAVAGRRSAATVTVTEAGNLVASGSVMVTVAFSSTAAATATTAAGSGTYRVALRAGKSKGVRVTFTFPASLAGVGAVYMVATVVNGTGLAADLNTGNNTAVSATTVTIGSKP